jgi:hypothetical protein
MKGIAVRETKPIREISEEEFSISTVSSEKFQIIHSFIVAWRLGNEFGKILNYIIDPLCPLICYYIFESMFEEC